MTEPQDVRATESQTSDSDDGPWEPDPADDPTPGVPGHLAPDDVGPREWVDPSKDPTPGYPGHAAPGDSED